jgi:hypothetical protein
MKMRDVDKSEKGKMHPLKPLKLSLAPYYLSHAFEG